ncbi:flagellin lysine-N-methylase [Pantoea sp. GM01]|uniref:flagellin lysine-N-methylase n=1 Tax=Pantoea sp. GM01 TaxID=1144320 RepID=UPI000270F093|nr:flagellin lysine-N-methylase [Pantoea sp. GM01]EJL93164.1 hypothetical protein PMI17_00433 [Pantoea sp. GM01]
MNEILIVEPQFFTTFECVGGACIDHCCKDWDIVLNKSTVNLYKNSSDIEIRKISDVNVINIEIDDGNWGRVKLKDTGNCSFLDNDCLCKVQKSLGEDALSPTCAIYPRVYTSHKYEIRSNLTLSCPEATRMLLTNTGSMLFNEKIKKSNYALDAPDVLEENRLLNLMCVNIMVGCGKNIEVGLYGVLKILSFHDDLLNDNNVHDKLLNYFDGMMSSIDSGELIACLDKITPNYKLQGELFTRLKASLSKKNEGRGSKPFQFFLQKTSNLIGKGMKYKELLPFLIAINSAWDGNVNKCTKNHPYFMSNYIQYRMYEDFFPFKNGKDALLNVSILMVEWFLLKLLIASVIELDSNITEVDLVKLFYSYHSITRHDNNYEDNLLDDIMGLEIEGYSSLIYLLK